MCIQCCIPLCFSQIKFKNGRTQIAKGGYPKMKPCSDVNEKTRSKFIGRVHKNTAVSSLRNSLSNILKIIYYSSTRYQSGWVRPKGRVDSVKVAGPFLSNAGPRNHRKNSCNVSKHSKNLRGSFGLITPAIQTSATAGVMSQMIPAGLFCPRTSCFHTLRGQRTRGQGDTAPFSCMQT